MSAPAKVVWRCRKCDLDAETEQGNPSAFIVPVFEDHKARCDGELYPLCQVCGEPATTCELDSIIQTDDYRSGFKHSKPNGGYHVRCDEHPHETTIIRTPPYMGAVN